MAHVRRLSMHAAPTANRGDRSRRSRPSAVTRPGGAASPRPARPRCAVRGHAPATCLSGTGGAGVHLTTCPSRWLMTRRARIIDKLDTHRGHSRFTHVGLIARPARRWGEDAAGAWAGAREIPLGGGRMGEKLANDCVSLSSETSRPSNASPRSATPTASAPTRISALFLPRRYLTLNDVPIDVARRPAARRRAARATRALHDARRKLRAQAAPRRVSPRVRPAEEDARPSELESPASPRSCWPGLLRPSGPGADVRAVPRAGSTATSSSTSRAVDADGAVPGMRGAAWRAAPACREDRDSLARRPARPPRRVRASAR